MAGKISISVTDEHAALLQEAVGSGAYASSSEVVREALREWRVRRVVGQLWDEGFASGRCGPGTTMADIKREARNRGNLSQWIDRIERVRLGIPYWIAACESGACAPVSPSRYLRATVSDCW